MNSWWYFSLVTKQITSVSIALCLTFYCVMLHTSSRLVIFNLLLHVISLLQISFASAVSALSDRTRFRNFFRTYPNFENFVPALVSVLKHYNWSRIVFLTQDENLFNQVIASLIAVTQSIQQPNLLLGCYLIDFHILVLASFPGPAQLSVACSTVKRERAWYLFSRE